MEQPLPEPCGQAVEPMKLLLQCHHIAQLHDGYARRLLPCERPDAQHRGCLAQPMATNQDLVLSIRELHTQCGTLATC